MCVLVYAQCGRAVWAGPWGSLVRPMAHHWTHRLNAKHEHVLGHCAVIEWERGLVSIFIAPKYFSWEISKYCCALCPQVYVGIPTGSVLIHACVISGQLDNSSCAYISLWAGFQISVVIVVLLIIRYVKGDNKTLFHTQKHKPRRGSWAILFQS